MAPPTLVAPPSPEAVTKSQTFRAGPPATPPCVPPPVHRGPELFAEALLDMSSTRPAKRFLDFFLSALIHFTILAVAVLLPLYFTEAIDLKRFTSTMLVAPPPPPPPPPPAAPAVVRVAPVRRVFTQAGKLMAPSVIPERVAMLKEEELPPDLGAGGVAGGVPGGVPGGQLGGVIGGIIGGIAGSNLPPPPKAAPRAPVRVGGRIREPRPLMTPQPAYPPLARQAKISGDVIIDAVIDTNGNVVEMKAVSGHPLLLPAAMEVLRKWKYEPTYLNDEPIAVALLVTIRFRLE